MFCASTGAARSRRPRTPIPSGHCSVNSTSICWPRASTTTWPRASARMRWWLMGCRACALPYGRRMRGAFPWSATSTPGTGGAIRCGCATRPGCGRCSFRASARGALQVRAARPGRLAVPLKADPVAWRDEPPPGTASVVDDRAVPLDRRGLDWSARRQAPDAPISIYEVHAESWLRRKKVARSTGRTRRAADRYV